MKKGWRLWKDKVMGRTPEEGPRKSKHSGTRISKWELLCWVNSWENKTLQGRTTRARDQRGQSPEQNRGLWDGRALPSIAEHPWRSKQSGNQRKSSE